MYSVGIEAHRLYSERKALAQNISALEQESASVRDPFADPNLEEARAEFDAQSARCLTHLNEHFEVYVSLAKAEDMRRTAERATPTVLDRMNKFIGDIIELARESSGHRDYGNGE